MAAQPPPVQTVGSQYLNSLNVNLVFNPNFDPQIALYRALKVFLVSYVEYETICPQLYHQKLMEYVNALQFLYNHPVPNVNQYIQLLNPYMALETIELRIGIIKYKGRDQLIAPRVRWSHGGIAQPNPIALDNNSELQNNISFFGQMLFNDLRQHRRRNTQIGLHLEADNLDQTERLKDFQITYRSIHAEGFDDWFDFGKGVQLLIKIEFRVSIEPNVTPQNASSFHFQTIDLMIGKRLENYRAQVDMLTTGHKKVTHKSKVTYIRKPIDPNSEQAFWSTPTTPTNILEDIKGLSLNSLRDRSLRTTKFNDLQIGYQFQDEFEESVCLCSEWCNWNAFFHFNPIYRFLLVRHNQLYLQNRTNIPDMYLMLSTVYSFDAGHNLQAIPKTPLIQLIGSANDCRIKYYEEYCLRFMDFRVNLNQSYPNFSILCGLSYNFLRYHPIIPQLCLQSDPNPFADNPIDNLITYSKVLSDLHEFCSRIQVFVQQIQLSEWFDELDRISREKYKIYIKLSYDKQMTVIDKSYDYLFSEEYKYSTLFPKTQGAKDVKAIRDSVQKAGNPFNMRYMCNEFVVTFISVQKFFGKVEPTLPKPHRTTAYKDMYVCCQLMDVDFRNYNTNPNNPKVLHFWIPDDDLNRSGLQVLKKHFDVFYTLKLYSIGYEIQNFSINSVLKYQKRFVSPLHLMFDEFELIFDKNLIENEFQTKYVGESLFEINPQLIGNIDDFYDNYWGLAQHEANAQVWNQLDQYISSSYTQYQRLYFWWRNDGNNTLKFRRMFDTFYATFENNIIRSENVFNTYIVESIHRLHNNYDNYLEVLDQLVYYLVKANCFMILATVSRFLRRFKAIQIQNNIIRKINYSLSKPGWIQLFRTMRRALEFVNRLKTLYIVFDNEINTISETLNQLKRLVKEVYRLFYKRFSFDFLDELIQIYGQPNLAQPLTSNFLPVHFAVGISFIVHFIHDFRFHCSIYRRLCQRVLQVPPLYALAHQGALFACQIAYRNFLSDINAVQSTEPLLSHHWQNQLPHIINAFNQNTANTLGINMAGANI